MTNRTCRTLTLIALVSSGVATGQNLSTAAGDYSAEPPDGANLNFDDLPILASNDFTVAAADDNAAASGPVNAGGADGDQSNLAKQIIDRQALASNPNAPVSLRRDQSGLGDILQSFFFSPKKEIDGWIISAGPVGYYPTATESALGLGKWGAGPTFVVLRQEHGFTYGLLANQAWSVGGQQGRRNFSSMYLQPFLSTRPNQTRALAPIQSRAATGIKISGLCP
jgi:hypothetical protein